VPPAWRSYDPEGNKRALDNARAALVECFLRHDVAGKPTADTLDLAPGTMSKSWNSFTDDLFRLAQIGANLYTQVLSQLSGVADLPAYEDALAAALHSKGLLQIARSGSAQYAFPWALVHDYPLDFVKDLAYCQVLNDSGRQVPWADGPRDACPYDAQPWHERNIICPYGFWGPGIHGRHHGDPAIRKAVDDHLARLTSLGVLQPAAPAATWQDVAAVLPDARLLYFLCHGEFDAGCNAPYLGIGVRAATSDERVYPPLLRGLVSRPNAPHAPEASYRDDQWLSHLRSAAGPYPQLRRHVCVPGRQRRPRHRGQRSGRVRGGVRRRIFRASPARQRRPSIVRNALDVRSARQRAGVGL
jgi:hypothetical protein